MTAIGPMKRTAALCRDIPFSKIWSGAAYGAEAYTYRASTIADLELNTPQSLLLALLHCLVAGDVASCILLADICRGLEKLRSRHYKIWLLEDFVFPRTDIEKALSLLAELVADGALKLPTHLMAVMTSLANKYRISAANLRTLLEVVECCTSMKSHCHDSTTTSENCHHESRSLAWSRVCTIKISQMPVDSRKESDVTM